MRLDLIILARQEMTRDWWSNHRHKHDVYISEAVLDEAADGDEAAAEERLRALEGLPVLETSEAVQAVTAHLVAEDLVPAKAFQDAVHIAMATVHQMDVLLTWNCTHLANAAIGQTIPASAGV